MVLQFVLTDEAAGFLDKELRPDRTTYEKRLATGSKYVRPFFQKLQACSEGRESLKQSCASWFCSNLPGYFAASGGHANFPSAEFIMFQKARPYPPVASTPFAHYLRALGMENNHEAWETGREHLTGLRAVFSGSRNVGPLGGFTLAARESDFLPKEDLKIRGGRNRKGYTDRLSSFGRVVTVWGLGALLTAFQEYLAGMRNRVASVELADLKSAAGELESAQANLLRLSGDLVPVVSELKIFCESPDFFRFGV